MLFVEIVNHVSYVLAIVHLLCGQSVVVIGTVLFFHQFFIWSCLAGACAVSVYNHYDALAKREHSMSVEKSEHHCNILYWYCIWLNPPMQ